VCAALPAAAPALSLGLIARGLRDPDARVRAACVEAVARVDRGRVDAAMLRRLRALAGDRDRLVRAGAVAVIGRLDREHPVRAAGDPAPEVRAAAAAAASEPELRALAIDPSPEVRAAAIAALGGRAGEAGGEREAGARAAITAAAADPSPVVRRAAAVAARDDAVLERLARDASPEVAGAALVHRVELRGRAALTPALLDQLAAAPARGPERVRIALAWLLAR
jgi:hypothetical protein